MGQQYIIRTITYTSGTTPTSTTMYEAQIGTRGPSKFRRWYECQICGEYFPEDKVILSGGGAFCIPNKDYLEMDGPRGGGQV